MAKEESHRYFKKIETTCSELNGKPLSGYKLVLLSHDKSQSSAVASCSYEMDKIFAAYPKTNKIEILNELLSFEGDTSLCSKLVCRYGYSKLASPQARTYTTQIDALYLLTLLTASSYSPYYCPYPVLIDAATGEEINNNSAKVKEVFSIYRKWFANNRRNNFENYDLPFKSGSRYEWYGADKERKFIFSDSFAIKQLDASAIVIGNCKD